MFDVLLLGKKIGTAESYDTFGADDTTSSGNQYYGFVPETALFKDLHIAGMVAIDHISGEITVWDERGTSKLATFKYHGDLEFGNLPKTEA